MRDSSGFKDKDTKAIETALENFRLMKGLSREKLLEKIAGWQTKIFSGEHRASFDKDEQLKQMLVTLSDHFGLAAEALANKPKRSAQQMADDLFKGETVTLGKSESLGEMLEKLRAPYKFVMRSSDPSSEDSSESGVRKFV